MTREAPPSSGWLCTRFDADFAIHLVERGAPPVIYRAAPDTGIDGMVLIRHCGMATELLILNSGLPVRLAPGVWIARSNHSARSICIHADPAARTSRRWHYHLNHQETSVGP